MGINTYIQYNTCSMGTNTVAAADHIKAHKLKIGETIIIIYAVSNSSNNK